MGLDGQTLLLISGCLYMLLPLNTWLVLSKPRPASAKVWCVAGMIGGVALFLISLRGVAPDLVSYGGYSLLLVSMLGLTQSLRMDIEEAWPVRRVGLVGILHFTVVVALLGLHGSLAVLVRACNLLVVSWWGWTAIRLARRERSANAWMIVLALVPIGAAVLANLVASIRGESPLQDLRTGTANLLVGLTLTVGALLMNMGYLGLQLERALAHNTRVLQQRTRAARRSARRRELVAQERPLSVGVLADSLAHALLQPLSALVIHAQIGLRSLQQGQVDAALLGRVLSGVREQLERISEQVGHIRKFIVPGHPSTLERVDLRRLIGDVEPLVRQEAINQEVRLVLTLPSTEVMVRLEPLALMQALLQLVRNAVTAAAGCTPGEVRIELQVQQGMACVAVHDSGPGFSPEQLQRLQRGDAPLLGQHTGLGLWMARRIMTTCGGKLDLSNPAQGGACVVLQCPLD